MTDLRRPSDASHVASSIVASLARLRSLPCGFLGSKGKILVLPLCVRRNQSSMSPEPVSTLYPSHTLCPNVFTILISLGNCGPIRSRVW